VSISHTRKTEKVVFDIDGVVADMTSAALMAISDAFGVSPVREVFEFDKIWAAFTNIDVGAVKNFMNELWEMPEFYWRLSPFGAAKTVADELASAGVFAGYVTARPLHAAEATIEWLNRFEMPMPGRVVFQGPSTLRWRVVASGYGANTMFVDDSHKSVLETLLDRGAEENNIGGVVCLASYNRAQSKMYGLDTVEQFAGEHDWVSTFRNLGVNV